MAIVHVPVGYNLIPLPFTSSDGVGIPEWVSTDNVTFGNDFLTTTDTVSTPHLVVKFGDYTVVRQDEGDYCKLKVTAYSNNNNKLYVGVGGSTSSLSITTTPTSFVNDLIITNTEITHVIPYGAGFGRFAMDLTPILYTIRTVTFSQLELYRTVIMDDPENFLAILTSVTTVDLTWVLNDLNDVMIAWSSDGVFGVPTGSYNIGDDIESIDIECGTVIYNDNGTTTSDTTIDNGETRYYKIWTWKDGGDWEGDPLTGTYHRYYSDGVGIASIGNPQSFSGVATSESQIDLSWDLNMDGNDVLLASGNTDATPSGSYNVGDEIIPGCEVLYIGTLSPFLDTLLDSSTSYNYKIWSYDGSSSYSTGLMTTVSTTNPIDNPIDFTVIIININQLFISWELNPDDDYVLLASGLTDTFGTPSGPYTIGGPLGGGTILLDGLTSVLNYTDNNSLIPEYTLYYKAWSKVGDTYSPGVLFTITVPEPASIGGFNGGTFNGGTFLGNWHSGRWIDGTFLGTWNSSDPRPRT